MAVEIGPGKGALTKRLLDRAGQVIAVEVDPYLVHYLRQKFRENSRLSIIESDVLKADLSQWGPAVITGNLPYYITSPIIAKTFASPGWQRAVFLVQKEVAERITAAPGTREYGYLTVFVALHSVAELLFPVARAAFAPPPKVESAVVRLTPRNPQAEWGIPNSADFLKFAGLAFQHKRKTLRNNLRDAFPGIDGLSQASARAEQLSITELAGLYRKLIESGPLPQPA